MSGLKEVIIYTDGSCLSNPGPGGFAVVLLHGNHRRELTGGYRLTTNNRMELMAAIVGLRTLKYPCRVTVYSDATYVVDGVMKGSMRRWRSTGWLRGTRNAVPNNDLWEELLRLCDHHEVQFSWVPGHTGITENERCNSLSMRAALSQELEVDEGYEQRELQEQTLLNAQPSLFDGFE